MLKQRWNTERLIVFIFLSSIGILSGCHKNNIKGFKTPRIRKIELVYEIDTTAFITTIADFNYLNSGKPEKIYCYEGSTTVEYEINYNNLGNPDSLNIFYSNVDDGNYTRRFCLKYSDLILLSGIEEVYNDYGEDLLSISFEYDGSGRISRVCKEETGCYIEYTYSDDDNIIELLVFVDDEPDPYKSAIYSFDSNPNPFDNNCPFLNSFVSIGILNGVSYQSTYFINENNITALSNSSGEYSTYYQFNYIYREDEYPVETEVSVSEKPVYTYLYTYY